MLKRFLAAAIFISFVAIISCHRDLDNVDCSGISATYNTDIRAIIDANCISCHDDVKAPGDYNLYSYLKTVADNGKLEERTIGQADMPPSKRLSLDDRKKIKCWIKNGAPNN